MKRPLALAVVFLAVFSPSAPAVAMDWQTTELQYQRGKLAAPTFVGSAKSNTDILTLQHASGWSFGDIFFFADYLDDSQVDGFNDSDLYSELYVNFSLGKLTGRRVGAGAIKDIGLLAGINDSHDARVRKYLPGIRLSWELPGFAFFNTDLTLYLDDSAGLAGGGAPAEDDSYMLDINWAYPFEIGQHRFSIEGHAEYIGERRNELGQTVREWVLLQPQFRYDLGHRLWQTPGRFYVGVEWQYWRNKLGDPDTDENVLQALAVLRL